MIQCDCDASTDGPWANVHSKHCATQIPFEKGWRDLKDAPIDEWVILATTGDWVGQAIFGENEENPTWRWAFAKEPMHPNLEPLYWMPLPAHPDPGLA